MIRPSASGYDWAAVVKPAAGGGGVRQCVAQQRIVVSEGRGRRRVLFYFSLRAMGVRDDVE